MDAVRLDRIRPAVQELLAAVAGRAPHANELCVTFSVSDREDAWVQLTHDNVNLGYPHSEQPLRFLRRHFVPALPGESLLAFESGKYATLAHRSSAADELSVFIDRLLTAVHELPPDVRLDVEFTHL